MSRVRGSKAYGDARWNAGARTPAPASAIGSTPDRAVKAEALLRRTTILTLIGEILSDSSPTPVAGSSPTEPRWRRTGEGRKANQYTRIDIGDEAWCPSGAMPSDTASQPRAG